MNGTSRTLAQPRTPAGGIHISDLVSIAAEAAADRDYPHDVRDLISRRACQLAQHACTPTAAAALSATRTRAIVLDDAGHHQQAAELWGQLITRHHTVGQAGPALQARLAHATCLHRQGRCIEALDLITIAWQTATETTDDDAPTVATVLQLYRLMLDACHPRPGTAQINPPQLAGQPDMLAVLPPVADAGEHQQICAYQAPARSRARR
ncbi:hypothetical protein [Winogradskya humida]|uniref:Uncharacterized protein n=1 Tax=Winogradskya humida TaxID=113566 RepID=A0ABQ4A1S4_9ACTN|nr:hypothetical protein [Actinoplanes humidus]GIE24793.1 hypothetical protein Ahu01nite_078950 [Actinoplanes humidus]